MINSWEPSPQIHTSIWQIFIPHFVLGSVLGSENRLVSKTGTAPTLMQWVIWGGDRLVFVNTNNYPEKKCKHHSDKWYERQLPSVKRTYCKEVVQGWRLWKPFWGSDVWAVIQSKWVNLRWGGKGGDSPGKASEGKKGDCCGYEDLKDSQRHCRTEREGLLTLGAGSSHSLEGFSVHPPSNRWKGKAVSEFQLEGQETRSDLRGGLLLFGASLVAQRLKHLPAMWETRVRSLVWEDALEKEMATHSSTLAWRIPWREEPSGLQSTGSQRVRYGCLDHLNENGGRKSRMKAKKKI